MKRREAGSEAAAEPRRGRFAGPLFAALAVLAGLTMTGLTFTELRSAQHANAERVMDQRAEMARAAVRAETERYSSLLQATAAGLAIDDRLTWEDYDAASAPLGAAGLKGASSVAFVVPAATAEVAATQAFWRGRGASGLTLKPVGTAGEHYFSIFVRPLGAGRPVSGLDVAGSPEASQALLDARRTGQPTVSDTYVLLRDRNLPRAEQQLSFVFVAPLWTRATRPAFRGWLVLGLRGADFLDGVLATVSQGHLAGELLARNADGARPAIARYDLAGRADLVRELDFSVADREWTLVTRADSRRLPGGRSSLPYTVLAGGTALTLCLALLMYVLATGRARAWARVQEATADLRRANAESHRQAGLLAAVMTSIGDGVGVVDEHGRFLLHNPAAQDLLGVGADSDDPDAWQGHYGLFRADGRTPFPVDDLPLMRALRGESSDGVEILVRNPGRPEGVLLSVDGRPLDASAGQHGAVAVFHDITEIRRYETDLAVFAGVVAHDLKAPLTLIRAHAEAATEHLAAAPGHPEVTEGRDALFRVIRSVDRMAALIDTLLAYSTARDAPLRTHAVDLDALVAEVVQDRVGHLHPADRPTVHLGPLPPVRADPAMLRHLLDNLIGNALKYVRPGTVARIEVTGSRPEPGWTRIEVADRGIGIPDGDKPDVFERFHRAHAGAGYTGTGLGLAICKRIVERHGGRIGVTDNPGGGTRFQCTLPAPVREEEIAMTRKDDDEAGAREALERALAQRAAMEHAALPGLSALPAADPSAHDPSAARLQAPVPDHHPATGAKTD